MVLFLVSLLTPPKKPHKCTCTHIIQTHICTNTSTHKCTHYTPPPTHLCTYMWFKNRFHIHTIKYLSFWNWLVGLHALICSCIHFPKMGDFTVLCDCRKFYASHLLNTSFCCPVTHTLCHGHCDTDVNTNSLWMCLCLFISFSLECPTFHGCSFLCLSSAQQSPSPWSHFWSPSTTNQVQPHLLLTS